MLRKAPAPAELQAARFALAERCEFIAMKHVPPGVEVEYRMSLSGRAYYATAERRPRISAPRPRTRKALYIFLHECGHFALGHMLPGVANRRKPRHVEEMEAERWAHETMRAEGLAVPRAMTARAKRYVAQKIDQARRRGAKTIDRGALAFAAKK